MRKGNSIIWKCQCDCYGENSIVFVPANELTSGRVKSCGCLQHQSKYKDLTGMKFGRWEVLYLVGKDEEKRNMIWHCRCSCEKHTERDLLSYQLTLGVSTSCGCYHKEIASQIGKNAYKDLTGMKFGKLTAISKIDDGQNGPKWLCECDCDNHTKIIVSSRALLTGRKLSCGCLSKSYGEYVIEQLLRNNNIKFVKNMRFDNCRFPDTNRYGFFDFFVDNKYVIEFDGMQHFIPHSFQNNSKSNIYNDFNKIRWHDIFKTNYCFNHDIPIIRIPYFELATITIDDLLINSKYIMVKDDIRSNMSINNYFTIPEFCPVCGAKTAVRKDGDSEVLYCTNNCCPGKILGLWKTFTSDKGMDVDGLSEYTLERFLKLGYLTNMFISLYELKNYRKELYKLDGFGKKSIDNILKAIEKSKDVSLANFICAFSIPGVGVTQSKILAKEFHTFEDFAVACDDQFLFSSLDGFGPIVEHNIHNWWMLNSVQMTDVSAVVNIKNEYDNPAVIDSPLAGITCVVTGSVNLFKNRAELQSAIEAAGGKVVGSVSKNTDYLINNDTESGSSKNIKAKNLGVKIISEQDFVDLFLKSSKNFKIS